MLNTSNSLIPPESIGYHSLKIYVHPNSHKAWGHVNQPNCYQSNLPYGNQSNSMNQISILSISSSAIIFYWI